MGKKKEGKTATAKKQSLMNLASVFREASSKSYLQDQETDQRHGAVHLFTPLSRGRREGGTETSASSSPDLNLSIEDEGTSTLLFH